MPVVKMEDCRLHMINFRATACPRKRIFGAICEAVERGLVKVTIRGGLYGIEACRTASRYRLTWIGSLRPDCAATNEWKRYRPKKISPVADVGTVEPPMNRSKTA